jgi:UDPglucose 6-dehydrogenase/GDP-mannose 6-dehydrogenase
MNLSIVGTGYVGLVTGVCLAERGHNVTCIDVDRNKVDMINAGRAPIHETGLPELLGKNIGRRLTATTDLARAVHDSEVTFIAVGTPATEGRIDLRYVEAAAAEVGRALREKHSYHALVIKSTVIPGTTDGAVRRSAEAASGKRAGEDFGLGMNPEFLTEGRAIEDFTHPDRIVLGGIDERTHDLLSALYAGFSGVPRLFTNNATAEMIKYASNSLLATMISFSNEIARLCTAVGDVDVVDVMRGVHQSLYLTTRQSGREPVTASIASFLEAGCGFGGSCLPKDVTALAAQGEQLGVRTAMLRATLEVNAGQPDELIALLQRHFNSLSDVPVTVLGLAFKPDTDDLRESPAFPVIRRLRAAGARITAFDPVARPGNHPDLEGVRLADSLEESVQGAQAVVLVTRWAEFNRLPQLLAGSKVLVVDGRRVLDRNAFGAYEGIGWRRTGSVQ